MEEEDLPPRPQLMDSLRAVGYTLEAAVADLIDNSITAAARQVDVYFNSGSTSYLAVVDDGRGMTATEVKSAMSLAGTSPLGTRAADDLGRFGLGLKTASLSQCRELTLVTKKPDEISAVRWDLDHLHRTGRWALLRLSTADMAALPRFAELNQKQTGTLVLWRRLDRLPSASPAIFARAFDAQMIGVKEHLSLVFHRFLSGADTTKLTITLNGNRLRQVDPFLSGHRATQRGPAESFTVAGERIEIQPFTLPYISKLTQAERETAQISGRLRESQGFYIYRAKRLVIWGTWFRLAPKDDLVKLARVRVDIPNTLDHLWSLDIKKSAAAPPVEVRDQLKRIVNKIVFPSKRAQLFRGRPAPGLDAITHIWNLIEDRSSFRYELNRNHPLFVLVEKQLQGASPKLLDSLLTSIESSFPIEDAYNRMGGDDVHAPTIGNDDHLVDYARSLWAEYEETGESAEEFIRRLRSVEPFSNASDPEGLLRKATV